MIRQSTIAAFTIVAVASCGSDTSSDTTTTPFQEIHAALCRAADAAADGDGSAARTEFIDHVHQPLHELAAQASRTDRAAAGRLLERKERVESALDGDPAELAARLDQLIPAAAAAITATGEAQPPTCQEMK